MLLYTFVLSRRQQWTPGGDVYVLHRIDRILLGFDGQGEQQTNGAKEKGGAHSLDAERRQLADFGTFPAIRAGRLLHILHEVLSLLIYLTVRHRWARAIIALIWTGSIDPPYDYWERVYVDA